MPFNLNPAFQTPNSKQSPSKLSTPSAQYQTLNTSSTQKTLTPQYLQKKFEELYLQNQRWTAKRQKLREQYAVNKEKLQLNQCTFQPSLNPQISYNGSNPSPFLKRQIDWLNKKDKRIQQLARQTSRKHLKQCSFKPKISSKSYAILNHAFKTSRTFKTNNQTNTHKNKTFEKQKNYGCYRQIHMKHEEYKKLQKVNSTHRFMLMTERRFVKKMGLQEDQDEIHFGAAVKDNQTFNFNEGEDYIENIVIKTQEQNTFDSLTSLDLKTARKTENKGQQQKTFEENQEDNDNEENGEQLEGNNEKNKELDKKEEAEQMTKDERQENEQEKV